MPAAAAPSPAAAASSPHRSPGATTTQTEEPAKKLSKEEIQKCADRLSHPIQRNVDTLPPLVPKRVISKEEVGHSIDKLYAQSMSRKKQLLEDIQKKKTLALEVKVKQMPSNELEGTFDRLYAQQMELKRRNEQKLKEQQAAENRTKKFNKDEMVESAKRLCDASIEKAREAHRNLFEKYVTATEPKYKRLTKEELEASAARLCKKE